MQVVKDQIVPLNKGTKVQRYCSLINTFSGTLELENFVKLCIESNELVSFMMRSYKQLLILKPWRRSCKYNTCACKQMKLIVYVTISVWNKLGMLYLSSTLYRLSTSSHVYNYAFCRKSYYGKYSWIITIK